MSCTVPFAQVSEVLFCDVVWSVAEVKFEHIRPGVDTK